MEEQVLKIKCDTDEIDELVSKLKQINSLIEDVKSKTHKIDISVDNVCNDTTPIFNTDETKTMLISFGEYLLSEERAETIRDGFDLSIVYSSDIENWKAKRND